MYLESRVRFSLGNFFFILLFSLVLLQTFNLNKYHIVKILEVHLFLVYLHTYTDLHSINVGLC